MKTLQKSSINELHGIFIKIHYSTVESTVLMGNITVMPKVIVVVVLMMKDDDTAVFRFFAFCCFFFCSMTIMASVHALWES